MVFKYANRVVETDPEGYLLDFGDWSREIAVNMAESDELKLSDDHWTIINFLHGYYEKYEVAPELAILSKALCGDLGDCKWNRKYIKQLFPLGAAKMACRYAGLPRPVGTGCV